MRLGRSRPAGSVALVDRSITAGHVFAGKDKAKPFRCTKQSELSCCWDWLHAPAHEPRGQGEWSLEPGSC